MNETIPPMTDPLGRYWNQPPANQVLVDDDCAMMTKESFAQLLEYSSSIPSGTYAGKMWKCRSGSKWFLRWYVDDPNDPKQLLIPARRIVIVSKRGRKRRPAEARP